MGKDIIILGADMSFSVHIDYKNKDIWIPGGGPTQGLGDITLIPETNIPLILHNQEKYLY